MVALVDQMALSRQPVDSERQLGLTFAQPFLMGVQQGELQLFDVARQVSLEQTGRGLVEVLLQRFEALLGTFFPLT